jgi:uncharacterized protein (DUF2062 family)
MRFPADETKSRSRGPGGMVAALHRLRTEGTGPVRQAAAIGLGLLIGASPFYGFHLLLAVGLGRLFRLNRLKTYLAANISNPFIAPFLVAVELQAGSWVRRGQFYSASALDQVRVQGLAADLLIGSAIVGLVLGTTGAAVTYFLLRRRADPDVVAVIEGAAERYLRVGLGTWEFASAKLRLDPVYQRVLGDERLPRTGTVVDLGCGLGLMLALIASARDAARRGEWPAAWRQPFEDVTLVGVELRPRIARKARVALEGDARIETRDVADIDLPSCDAVLLFDVLQMLPFDEQERLVSSLRGVLRPGGWLVVREADRAGGWGFTLVRCGNRLRAIAEGRFGRRFHFRTATDWQDVLRRGGFLIEPNAASPAGAGTKANFLIYARRP